MDWCAEGLANKPGMVPVLGGRKRRYADHYRNLYAKWARSAKRQGKTLGRYTSPHGKRIRREREARESRHGVEA